MIARVEPLTRTRAVRGPFDYRLAPGQEVQVGSLLRVPFGARSSLGVVVELAERSELDPDRLVEPEAVLGAGVGADLVALAGWMAREYCSTPSRALQLMLAPGAADGHGRQAGACRRADRRRTGGAGRRRRPPQRPPARPARRRWPSAAPPSPPSSTRRDCGAWSPAGLVAIDRRARPRRPVRHEVGSASATAPPLTAEQSAALERLLDGAARAGGRPPRVPAAGRDRLGQDRGLSGRGGGGAAGGSDGDRARARDRAHAAGAVALSGPLRRRGGGAALGAQRRASATTSGCACAPARRGCAWARARRCSRRWTTSD